MRSVLVCLAIMIQLSDSVARTPATDFYDSISGEWIVEWCEHKGSKVKEASSVVSIAVNPETIVMSEADGETKTLRYKLLQGTDGWVIDLYATFGRAEGWIFPSRLAIENGKLKIMLPMSGDAVRRRPDSLDSKANPNWVVMYLIRSDVETKEEATDEQSATGKTPAAADSNAESTPRSP